MGKRKKENDAFLKKEAEERQNSAIIMISIDAKGTVFPIMLKLQGELFEKICTFFLRNISFKAGSMFLKISSIWARNVFSHTIT